MLGKLWIALIAVSLSTSQIATAEPLEGNVQAPEFSTAPEETFHLAAAGPGLYEIHTGSKLTATISSPLSTETANIGDSVNATLDQSMYADGLLVVAKGSTIQGVVTTVERARNEMRSKVSSHHWLDADGGFGIKFDTILLSNDTTLQISAVPSPLSEIKLARDHEAPMVVNQRGAIVPRPDSKKVKSLGLAIGAAGFIAPFGAGVALGGLAGAVAPTSSLHSAGAAETHHSRIKGMFVGAVDGLPGVGIAHSMIRTGTHAALNTGDSLTIEFEQPVVWKQPSSRLATPRPTPPQESEQL